MSKRAIWITVAVIAFVAAATLTVFALMSPTDDPAATPSATPTATPTPTPTLSAVATPTVTPTPASDSLDPTCKSIATDDYLAMMADNGWVGWALPYNGIGASPFEQFPDGAPAGAVACRWGEDPDIGTDNIIDLAWAPIDPDTALDAKDFLVAEGYERITAPEGVYLAMKGEEGWADSEGYAQTYLFTGDDVRWATFKDDIRYVKAPDEVG